VIELLAMVALFAALARDDAPVPSSSSVGELHALVSKLHAIAGAGDYAELQTSGLADALVAAVSRVDQYLTGKTLCRTASDLGDAEGLLEGDTWEVYLSDGGYSRLILQIADPEQPPIWIVRSLSREPVKKKWFDALEAMRLQEGPP
jgi:hypothetical protein